MYTIDAWYMDNEQKSFVTAQQHYLVSLDFDAIANKLKEFLHTLTRTSPAFGGATSTVSMTNGLQNSQQTAALHWIGYNYK